MKKETLGYWVPLLVALAIVVIGAVSIVGDSDVLNPKSTKTVTTAPVGKVEGAPKTTKEVTQAANGKVTKTVTTTEDQAGTPAQPQKKETTTEEGERTFTERVLGDGGLIALQIGAVLLAAFLVAAVLQRAILGQYAIKIGSLELSAVATDTTADALQAVGAKIDKVEKDRLDGAANVRDNLAVLYKRLDLLEKRLGP